MKLRHVYCNETAQNFNETIVYVQSILRSPFTALSVNWSSFENSIMDETKANTFQASSDGWAFSIFCCCCCCWRFHWRVETHFVRIRYTRIRIDIWKGKECSTFEAYSTVLVSNNWTGHHQYGVALSCRNFVSESTVRNWSHNISNIIFSPTLHRKMGKRTMKRSMSPNSFAKVFWHSKLNVYESNYQQISEQRKLNSDGKDSGSTIVTIHFNKLMFSIRFSLSNNFRINLNSGN